MMAAISDPLTVTGALERLRELAPDPLMRFVAWLSMPVEIRTCAVVAEYAIEGIEHIAAEVEALRTSCEMTSAFCADTLDTYISAPWIEGAICGHRQRPMGAAVAQGRGD